MVPRQDVPLTVKATSWAASGMNDPITRRRERPARQHAGNMALIVGARMNIARRIDRALHIGCNRLDLKTGVSTNIHPRFGEEDARLRSRWDLPFIIGQIVEEYEVLRIHLASGQPIHRRCTCPDSVGQARIPSGCP